MAVATTFVKVTNAMPVESSLFTISSLLETPTGSVGSTLTLIGMVAVDRAVEVVFFIENVMKTGVQHLPRAAIELKPRGTVIHTLEPRIT
jgi:hypothetical protein